MRASCWSAPTRGVSAYSDGPAPPGGKRWASPIGCISPGDCDDMPAALMLADVVVHASTEPEAFGRVVIEAQAMGRPVIASDLGGPVETVEHGVTGWRVPPGDPAALAAAIDRALDAARRAARRAMGARARAACCARCTTAAMQTATLDVYREVLAARRRG